MSATYKGPTGKTFQLSDSDTEWLARSIRGECGSTPTRDEAAAVCWALMNRFMLVRGFESWHSFTDLVRAFSQPVNPKWFADGEFCTAGGKYAGRPECDSKKTAWRYQLSHTPISSLGASAKFAREFQAGTLAPPGTFLCLERSRPTNWGATWLKKVRDGALVPLAVAMPWGVALAGNYFFEDPNLIAGEVTVNGKAYSSFAGFACASALGLLALGGALGGLGYLVYRGLV